MKVVEIFDSMQGEGQYMGIMCTFVRFAGCNLKCSFCDEASKYDKAKEMTIKQIVKKCKQEHVVLTGGEPTIQAELSSLIDCLLKDRHVIHVETNGTNLVPYANDPHLWITCSPKAPKFEINCRADEIKLVVDESLSLEIALAIARERCSFVWLQPCDGPDIYKSKDTILKWIKKYPNEFRAGIQLHKWYEVQ